jgi:hypothetical protein
MSEQSQEQALRFVTSSLASLSTKQDDMAQSIHQIEIHIAEIKAGQAGKVENIEHRIGVIEQWRESVNRYLIGIVITVLTGFIGLILQQFFHGGAK